MDFNHTDDFIALQGPGFVSFPNTTYVEDEIGALHGVGAGYDAANDRPGRWLPVCRLGPGADGEGVDGGVYAGVEVGIILKGLTSISDFDSHNIL
jgi:hypothetical protein